MINKLKSDIFWDGLEATAKRTYIAIKNQDRADVSIAIITRVLKEYYDKGHEDCKNKVKY